LDRAQCFMSIPRVMQAIGGRGGGNRGAIDETGPRPIIGWALVGEMGGAVERPQMRMRNWVAPQVATRSQIFNRVQFACLCKNGPVGW